MLPYVLDSGWYETHGYGDPIGRAIEPHPIVLIGVAMSSALLIGALALLGQFA
jgi:hypothetical protein